MTKKRNDDKLPIFKNKFFLFFFFFLLRQGSAIKTFMVWFCLLVLMVYQPSWVIQCLAPARSAGAAEYTDCISAVN